jgi:hypothetical protein
MKALKSFFTAVIFSLTSLSAAAQAPIYLFEEFTDGTVLLKNRSVVKTKFNLDIFHDKFLYMDGDQIMEMTDFSNVSVVTIGGRTFIPRDKSLYETIELDGEHSLFIKRHQKKNPLGKKVGYDQVAHGMNTQSLNPEYYSQTVTNRSQEVMVTVTDNKYFLLSGGKFRGFTDRRSFLKLFPDRKVAIEAYMDTNHILFTDEDNVVALTRFALGI